MKKLIAVATLLAIGAVASAQSASSVNAAGFVKKTAQPGQFILLSVPFEDFNQADRTVSNVIGNNVPYGTKVYLWDIVGQQYVSETYEKGTIFNGNVDKWNPGTNLIKRSDALFVRIPDTAVNPVDIFIFGEVPDSRTAETTTIGLVPGYQFLGFALPVAASITDPDLGLTPSYGDRVYFWNNGWDFIEYQKGTIFNGNVDKWSNVNFVFEPGSGYLYRSTSANQWVVTKNDFYAWP